MPDCHQVREPPGAVQAHPGVVYAVLQRHKHRYDVILQLALGDQYGRHTPTALHPGPNSLAMRGECVHRPRLGLNTMKLLQRSHGFSWNEKGGEGRRESIRLGTIATPAGGYDEGRG